MSEDFTQPTPVQLRIGKCLHTGGTNLNLSKLLLTDYPIQEIVPYLADGLEDDEQHYYDQKLIAKTLKRLTDLDLSRNELITIDNNNFYQFYYLQTLNLSRNKLILLPQSVLDMKQLEKLNISYNCFNNLPVVITKMKSLVTLDASYNNISEIPAEFEHMISLDMINLIGNSNLTTRNIGERVMFLLDKVSIRKIVLMS